MVINKKNKKGQHHEAAGKPAVGVNLMGQWRDKMEQATKDINEWGKTVEQKVQHQVEKTRMEMSKQFNSGERSKKRSDGSKIRHSFLPSFHTQATKKKICAPKLDHNEEDVIIQKIEESLKSASLNEKPFDQKEFLQNALEDNFLFTGLDDEKIKTLIDAFESYSVKTGDTIIKQGDEKADYFYILKDGKVKITKDEKVVFESKEDEFCFFGELALLYSAPRAASVIAITDCNLFRVDQKTFQYVMKKQTTKISDEKIALLKKVPELKDLDESVVKKLADIMKTETYDKDEYLYHKGEKCNSVYIVQEGMLKATDISVGGSKYEDRELGPGQQFGWYVIMSKLQVMANVVAAVDNTTALVIDAKTFVSVVGNLKELAAKAQTRQQLLSIPIFRDSKLHVDQVSALVDLIQTKEFPLETELIEQTYDTNAALYLVWEGQVYIDENTGSGTNRKCIEKGGYFGEEQLLADHTLLGEKEPIIEATYTAIVSQGAKLGVLTLENCRFVVNTTLLGLGKDTAISPIDDSIRMEDLTRHVMLGSGSFGQVWLASSKAKSSAVTDINASIVKAEDDTERQIYALKVQSKYQLIESGQAEAVVAEKNIMACLSHPFIIRLYNTYKDKQRVYMLESVLQGGELSSIIENGLEEQEAKFYAAGILEGMTYMHSRRIIHRDLKPENVLINNQGYPVLIDLGFAKYVADKTYTFCGTPMYIAPEVITQQGHDKGADHWSWACMIYEMIEGTYPFYEHGMDELALFKRIVRGRFQLAGYMSFELKLLLISLFVPERTRRLGSLADGWKDIYESYWFSDVDFDKLRKQKIKAPWIPEVENPLDSSNFKKQTYSKKDDLMEKIEPMLSKEEEAIFKTF